MDMVFDIGLGYLALPGYDYDPSASISSFKGHRHAQQTKLGILTTVIAHSESLC